jgi:5-methylcytosine-specific restriction endonuclease McrA
MIAFILSALTFLLIFFYLDKNQLPEIKAKEDALTALDNFLRMKKLYLVSNQWTKKRVLVLRRDSHTCRKCHHKSKTLHVHHAANYLLIPNEPIDSLVTLCSTCHKKEHELNGYPQTLSDYRNWHQSYWVSRNNEFPF